MTSSAQWARCKFAVVKLFLRRRIIKVRKTIDKKFIKKIERCYSEETERWFDENCKGKKRINTVSAIKAMIKDKRNYLAMKVITSVITKKATKEYMLWIFDRSHKSTYKSLEEKAICEVRHLLESSLTKNNLKKMKNILRQVRKDLPRFWKADNISLYIELNYVEKKIYVMYDLAVDLKNNSVCEHTYMMLIHLALCKYITLSDREKEEKRILNKGLKIVKDNI